MNDDDFLKLRNELEKKSYLTDDEFENYREVLFESLKEVQEDTVNNSFIANTEEIWKDYLKWQPTDTKRWRQKYKNIKKIEVSNLGKIRFTDINDKIEIKNQIECFSNKTGYLRLEGNYTALPDQFIYRFVAETWLEKETCDCDCWDVHHINNNGLENTPENLIWLKRCQHQKLHIFMKDSHACKNCLNKL